MQIFDILDPQLDIFQSRFLEASAGTGKTFAIEHLVIRLLLESEEPLSLPEILAVTFTREAAHEMKARIRARLTALSKEGNPRVRHALALFDEIQVFTIHGFCHRMLTEYAFEAKTPLVLSAPDRPEHLSEMEKTVEDFFRTGDPKFSYEITQLLKKSRFDLDQLVRKIVSVIQEGESPKEIDLPKLPPVPLDHLRYDVALLAPRYKRLKQEVWEAQLESFSNFLKNPQLFALLEEKEWFFEKMHEGNVKVRAPDKRTLSMKQPAFFNLLESNFLPKVRLLRDPDQMLLRIAAECRKRWECKASRHDHFTFDDLLQKMRGVLSDANFTQRVKERYKVAIIDEFQDTDSLQWSIFQELFFEKHLLYLVGDPKQSIYGFRNADIYTYMRAQRDMGSNSLAYLDTNYRSSPPLVDALNSLFTKRGDWINLPSSPGSLTYHPVKPGREETKLDEDPIIVFGARSEIGRARSFPTKQMEEELIFPYLASEILRLSDRICFSQMCVLIKDRYHAQRLQLHFNKWKIPSTIKRAFNLTQSRGYLEMELLLQALIHPDQESRVCAVMRKEGENPFYLLREIFEEKGMAPCFTQFLQDHFSPYADPSLYAELKQTAEILMEERGATLQELLYTLQELKRQSPEIDPRLKLRGEEGGEKVPIMTTFASKGLEFDVVFALSLAYRQREEEEDEERRAEKMRLLYVALTRAREKLYIPYIVEEKGAFSEPSSPIELFFQGEPENVQWIAPQPVQPLQTSQTSKELIPPPEVNLEFHREYLTSFSSMAKPGRHILLAEKFHTQNLEEKTPHTLPLGSETGNVIHAVFEALFLDRSLSIDQIVFETLSATHLEGWEEKVVDMVGSTLNLTLLPNFTLNMLEEGEFFPEMEFLFQKGNQLVKGFVDLVFRRGKAFYVLDWKTNWIGPSDQDYTEKNLKKVMQEHDYYLQAELYSEAIMRYVKRLDKEAQFGGAFYLFVRGNKAVHFGAR